MPTTLACQLAQKCVGITLLVLLREEGSVFSQTRSLCVFFVHPMVTSIRQVQHLERLQSCNSASRCRLHTPYKHFQWKWGHRVSPPP